PRGLRDRSLCHVLIEAGLARPVLILLLGVAAERTRYRRVSIRPWERGHLSTSTANVRASSFRPGTVAVGALRRLGLGGRGSLRRRLRRDARSPGAGRREHAS